MTFHIITIFPESIKSYFESSILKRAQKNKKIKIKFYNPRDYTKDKHKTVDEKQFGGGPGMVMRVDVIVRAVLSVLNEIKKSTRTKVIILSPIGRQFDQKMAQKWPQKYKDIIFICGHYEGIDARLKKIIKNLKLKIENLSIGPYVLTGGELPSAIIVDAISRQIPGVLGKIESLEENRGLGIPVYTRPEIFMHKGKKYKVPKVLLSGHHKNIEEWRKKNQKS
ncbi:tRNA (guanosine(37)-N1)-methyltransferase TrmD [Patescibacteria group bacterium]|nr:tRNA (guanosine(37)-N1)-methyltransferase TrmD [Patescibacteria group bacterium]